MVGEDYGRIPLSRVSSEGEDSQEIPAQSGRRLIGPESRLLEEEDRNICYASPRGREGRNPEPSVKGWKRRSPISFENPGDPPVSGALNGLAEKVPKAGIFFLQGKSIIAEGPKRNKTLNDAKESGCRHSGIDAGL